MSNYTYNRGVNRYSDEDISRFLAPYLSPEALDGGAPDSKRLKPQETLEEKQAREALEIVAPPASMTAVSESLIRICAKLSFGMYKASSAKDLDASTDGLDVEVVLFDNHGVLQATTPPFAIAVVPSLNTMILVWRGSMTKMDWVVDLAVAPVLSQQWSAVSKDLRAHAGYTSLVESDLCLHQDLFIAEIQKRNISQIICTGHSLAGAMAQIAQVAIQAQLQEASADSPWSRLSGSSMTLKSLQFGAPMSCMLVSDSAQDEEFWARLSKNACNIVFASDMLPRAPGNFDYVDKAVRNALVPFIKDAFKDVPIMSLIDLFPSALQKLVDMYQDETKKQDVVEIIAICQRFQHVGSIVWYESISSPPVKLDDYQFRTHRKYQYSIPISDPYPNRRLKQDHVKLPAALAHDTPKK